MAERNIFSWREPLGPPECPYAYRWVINFALFAIRLHKWVGSDELTAEHDHPYWFFTCVLKGRYFDVSGGSKKLEIMSAGKIRYRAATHRHSVIKLDCDGPCWTLLLTGPPLRKWGFWIKDKFIRRERFFKEYSRHQCE